MKIIIKITSEREFVEETNGQMRFHTVSYNVAPVTWVPENYKASLAVYFRVGLTVKIEGCPNTCANIGDSSWRLNISTVRDRNGKMRLNV